jgi:membrane-associated phospholipid phosphatase
MSSDLKEVPLPPELPAPRLGFAHRRRALRIGLLIGLGLFFVWLPGGARVAMLTALRAQWALAAMIGFFALIAISLVWSAGQRLDAWIFRFINLHGYHPKWLDRGMWLATQLGNLVTAGLLAILFFGLNYRGLAVEIIFGTLTLWLLVETLKALTHRARPFLDLEGTRIIGWRERGRSFPSGHTAQTFFLVTLLSHQPQLGLGGAAALYAVAVLVGFTRVYVGAHYPRDVLGGAVLGSAWGILATLVDPYWFGLRF